MQSDIQAMVNNGEFPADQLLGVNVVIPLDMLDLPEKELRYSINQENLDKLTETIKSIGLIEPLIVRPKTNGSKRFEIIAGSRRYRAAKEAGMNEVPVIIRKFNEEETLEAAIVENLQRENLNAFEETEAILRLLAIKLKITISDLPPLLHRIQNQIKERNSANNVIGNEEVATVKQFFTELGLMSMDSFINNRLPLLNLPPEILQVLRQGKIAYTKALAISRIPHESTRKKLLKEALETKMSLSNIKMQVRKLVDDDSKEISSLSMLKRRMGAIYKKIQKSQVPQHPSKRKQIEDLLGALEELLVDAS